MLLYVGQTVHVGQVRSYRNAVKMYTYVNTNILIYMHIYKHMLSNCEKALKETR